MGLDTSHNAWHGSYGLFHEWRKLLAEAMGLPPLELMEGFYESLDGSLPTLYHGVDTQKAVYINGSRYMDKLDKFLPISWDSLKPNQLHKLLYHSDCDGELSVEDCKDIEVALDLLIPELDGWVRERAEQFYKGLIAAIEANEPLLFH